MDSVHEIIYRVAELGLLDKSLMEKGIITSESIQKQWLIVTRKRKGIDKSKYWLLDSKDELRAKKIDDDCASLTTPEIINGVNNGVNGGNNQVNGVHNQQKENKNKKEKERDKYDK